MNIADRLKEKLHYDTDTGRFSWRVTSGGKLAGAAAGFLRPDGYISIGFECRLHLAHRLAWLYMTGEWPSDAIDHRNGNRSDNRWANIRPATWAENAQNRKRQITNTSGYSGVSFHRATGAWRAQIQSGGKKTHLGTFATPEMAHEAHLAAKRRLHPFQSEPREEFR